MLTKYNRFDFDEKAKVYQEHKLTTPEIKACLEDIKVLGKMDFKKILKWRIHMIDYKKLQDPNEQETELKVEEEIPIDPDEVMDEELEEKIKILDSKTKKAKKKKQLKKKQNTLKELNLIWFYLQIHLIFKQRDTFH